MLFPQKLRIFDQHDKEDGEDDGWIRFDFVFDVNAMQITCFKEHVLFDRDNNPTKCIQVFFTDGEHVFASYSMEKFLELYNGEYKANYEEYTRMKMILEGVLNEPLEEKKPGPLKRLCNWLW